MLTKRQQAVLTLIKACIDRDGCPPTIREIGDRFRIASPNGVKFHLHALRREGLIDWQPGKVRSIRVLGRTKTCPHCGKEIA